MVFIPPLVNAVIAEPPTACRGQNGKQAPCEGARFPSMDAFPCDSIVGHLFNASRVTGWKSDNFRGYIGGAYSGPKIIFGSSIETPYGGWTRNSGRSAGPRSFDISARGVSTRPEIKTSCFSTIHPRCSRNGSASRLAWTVIFGTPRLKRDTLDGFIPLYRAPRPMALGRQNRNGEKKTIDLRGSVPF